MQAKTKFKKTPIGEIPEDWRVVRLGEVIILKNGARPITMENGRYPVYGANGIMGYTSKYLIDQDFTIIIGRVGASGEIHLASGKIWISDNAIYSEKYDVKKVYPPYLLYLLKHKRLSKFASKTTHPIITQTFLKSFKIPLPPLSEQKKIAEILRTVDEAIGKTDLAIEKTERLKRGLMQRLLTKGIKHERFKKTEFGEIPEEWRVVKLKNIAKEFISGGTPFTKNPEYWNGNIPWIRSVHLTNYYIDESSIEQYITEKGLKNSSAKIVPKRNVIVATRVGIGKSAVNLIDVAINQDLTGIILDKSQVDPFFLVWYLQMPKILRLFESFSRGTTIKGIPQKHLRELYIPLPPLPEQKKITEILITVDKKLEFLKKRKEKLERIKKGLMKDLLTGRRRVGI